MTDLNTLFTQALALKPTYDQAIALRKALIEEDMATLRNTGSLEINYNDTRPLRKELDDITPKANEYTELKREFGDKLGESIYEKQAEIEKLNLRYGWSSITKPLIARLNDAMKEFTSLNEMIACRDALLAAYDKVAMTCVITNEEKQARDNKNALIKRNNDAVRHYKQAMVRLQKNPTSAAALKKAEQAKATFEECQALLHP